MRNPNIYRPKHVIDRVADNTEPHIDQTEVSGRSVWWWFLVMPGKVILWIEYMFPERITSVFGTARRRNIPLIQILYSLIFYLALIGLVFLLFAGTRGNG
jgi:hypothetical protein